MAAFNYCDSSEIGEKQDVLGKFFRFSFFFFLNLTTAKQTYSKIDCTVIEYRFVFHSTILNKNFRCLSFLKCLFPFDEMAHSGKGWLAWTHTVSVNANDTGNPKLF